MNGFLQPDLSKQHDLRNIMIAATTKALRQHFLQELPDEVTLKLDTIFPLMEQENREIIYLDHLVVPSAKADQNALRRRRRKAPSYSCLKLCRLCEKDTKPIRRRYNTAPKHLRATISDVVTLALLNRRQQFRREDPTSVTEEELAKDRKEEEELAYETATSVIHDWMDFIFDLEHMRVRKRKDEDFFDFRLRYPQVFPAR